VSVACLPHQLKKLPAGAGLAALAYIVVIEQGNPTAIREGFLEGRSSEGRNCYLIQFDKMEESERPRCRPWSCTRSRS
jgi:hypothetical protein